MPKTADAMIRLFYTAHTHGHEQVKNMVTALNESERFDMAGLGSGCMSGWKPPTR